MATVKRDYYEVLGVTRNSDGEEIRRAYRKLFFGDGLFVARLDAVEAELGHDPAVAQMVAFVRAGSARSLCQPGGRHED